MKPSRDILGLLEIMTKLRDPIAGCPWDIEQTFRSIAPYTLEEAYEVVDAIERGNLDDLRDELGDLLLQVVYHAQIAQERSSFSFGDVVEAITAKLIRRHPHVFTQSVVLSPDEVARNWQDIKKQELLERARAGGSPSTAGVLTTVPTPLPGLTRAIKLTKKAAEVGFDWADARLVIEKIREELSEVEAELDCGEPEALAGEIGDLLFAVANLARHCTVDPEAALRSTNAKFVRRFGFIEAALARTGRAPAESTLAEMDRLWNDAKDAESRAHVDGAESRTGQAEQF